MTHQPSDAFVFFGATGDLAYKMIFPALQALIKAGHMRMPIIGVARGGLTLAQLRSRVHASLKEHGGVDAIHRRPSSKVAGYNDRYNHPASSQHEP